MKWSKRGFLAHAATLGALGGAGLVSPCAALAKEALEPNPIMDIGPFYPVVKPLEQDADLTRLAGHRNRAKGQVLDLTGRVLDADGKPVAGAKVELWQANAAGRYLHPGDHHNLPLDPDFQGYGVQKTGGDGRFRFLTVKPAGYPVGDFMRAAHIHFDVSGKWDRLITQMYFPGDPYLGQDKILAGDLELYGGYRPDSIFGKLKPGAPAAEPDATLCLFDIVLQDG